MSATSSPGDPAARDPTAGDPTAGDPTAGDPAARDPAARDPAAGEPAGGEPEHRTHPGEAPDTSLTEIGYAEALVELEAILRELEGDAVDVDRLGAQVQRAAALIRLCRDRIGTARLQIERVVADLG